MGFTAQLHLFVKPLFRAAAQESKISYSMSFRQEHLVGALEVDGALPALRKMRIDGVQTPGALTLLAKALATGIAPQLQELVILTKVKENSLRSTRIAQETSKARRRLRPSSAIMRPWAR